MECIESITAFKGLFDYFLEEAMERDELAVIIFIMY